MSAAPRPTPADGPRLPFPAFDAAADLDYFIDTLYGDQRGWAEVSAIEGDPDAEYIFHQTWFNYDPRRKAQLIKRIATLSADYGNVYLTLTLYQKKKRDKAYALPGRVIVSDDAAPSDYTFILQTGLDKPQGFRVLDRLYDVTTREDLARREAYASGADTGGWDVTQIVRVPGTFNTKKKHTDRNGGVPWLVRLRHGSGRTFTPDELRARFKPAPPITDPCGREGDWTEAQQWIANPVPLIFNGIPRRFKNPNVPGARVLRGDLVPIQEQTGMPDTSDMRYAVIKSLVMHGYPDSEIRAIAWLLVGYNADTIKGAAWLRKDIDRCITRARADCAQAGKLITINPTRATFARLAAPVADTPRTSHARKDRPQRIDADSYLTWLQDHADAGHVMLTRPQIAAALGVSVPTVDRIEKVLRTRGVIERRTSQDRRYSWVVFVDMPAARDDDSTKISTIAADDDSTIQRIATPQIADFRARTCEEGTPAPDRTAPNPTPAASAPPEPAEAEAWEQTPIGELPKRKPRRVSLAALPLDEQIAKLTAQLGKVHKRKRYAAWLGHTRMVRGLERAAADLRERIEALEAQRPPEPPPEPPPGVQLGLDTAPAMGLSGAGVPSQSSQPVLDFAIADAPGPAPDPYPPGYVAGMIDRLKAARDARHARP